MSIISINIYTLGPFEKEPIRVGNGLLYMKNKFIVTEFIQNRLICKLKLEYNIIQILY